MRRYFVQLGAGVEDVLHFRRGHLVHEFHGLCARSRDCLGDSVHGHAVRMRAGCLRVPRGRACNVAVADGAADVGIAHRVLEGKGLEVAEPLGNLAEQDGELFARGDVCAG